MTSGLLGGSGRRGVTLLARATTSSLRVVAAVAQGIAEALELPREPAANLSTVAVEASRNVVAHAYPADAAGPMWLRIEPPGGPQESRDVFVSIRDEGSGCSVWPTAADPPGMGLSLSCELAEELSIRSRDGEGTSIEALVAMGETSDPPTRPPAPPVGVAWELACDETSLLGAVLPRAMVAQIDHPDALLDEIADVSLLGEAIADDLADIDDARCPRIRMLDPAGRHGRFRVEIGPLERERTEHLLAAARGAWTGPADAIVMRAEPPEMPTLAYIELAS
jgi:anti-sigma regulatory factor (Ser/Thr protein kinase)